MSGGRRGRRRRLAPALFALAGACFAAPDYDGLRCDADAPCPVELVCDADRRCHRPCRDARDCPEPGALCAADGRCMRPCTSVGDCPGAGERCADGACAPAPVEPGD